MPVKELQAEYESVVARNQDILEALEATAAKKSLSASMQNALRQKIQDAEYQFGNEIDEVTNRYRGVGEPEEPGAPEAVTVSSAK